jgi:hypothetical protein
LIQTLDCFGIVWKVRVLTGLERAHGILTFVQLEQITQ